MKINFYINEDQNTEEHLDIYINKSNELLNNIIFTASEDSEDNDNNNIKNNVDYISMIWGKKDNKVYPIPIKDIYRVYSLKNKIHIDTCNNNYFISLCISKLNSLLPRYFIQISKSEIINLTYIKHLELEPGTIKFILKNNISTYSSRRYTPKIKKYLNIYNRVTR